MKTPTGYRAALEVAAKTAPRSGFSRRLAVILCSLCIAIVAIMVAAPTLIFSASRREGQATAGHSLKPAETPAGNPENGQKLFKRYGCYECHGSHGQIPSRAGPALSPGLHPFDAFVSYVRHPTGSMPAYSEKVASNQDLADMYAFLQSTSHPPSPKTIPILSSASAAAPGLLARLRSGGAADDPTRWSCKETMMSSRSGACAEPAAYTASDLGK